MRGGMAQSKVQQEDTHSASGLACHCHPLSHSSLSVSSSLLEPHLSPVSVVRRPRPASLRPALLPALAGVVSFGALAPGRSGRKAAPTFGPGGDGAGS